MKKHVKRIDWKYWSRFNGAYELAYVWFRRPKTFNERKFNAAAKADGIRIRGKRSKLPTSWDDKSPSQQFGRDWKRFTKKRKQWE